MPAEAPVISAVGLRSFMVFDHWKYRSLVGPLRKRDCAVHCKGMMGNENNSAAELAVELHAGFASELQRLAKLRIANACGEIDERFSRCARGLAEQVHGFFLGVGLLTGVGLGTLDELHIDGHFDFHYINAVTVFGELPHALDDDLRLLFGKVEAFLIYTFFIADELEEKGDVVGAALVTQTLNPGVLLVVDFLAVEWSVVEQDLDAISASFLQTADRPVVEQIRQASRTSLVIPGFLIGEQQASVLGAQIGRAHV